MDPAAKAEETAGEQGDEKHGSKEWAISSVTVHSDGGGLSGRSITRLLDRLE